MTTPFVLGGITGFASAYASMAMMWAVYHAGMMMMRQQMGKEPAE